MPWQWVPVLLLAPQQELRARRVLECAGERLSSWTYAAFPGPTLLRVPRASSGEGLGCSVVPGQYLW